jgi:hypothetical protein
MMRPTPSQLAHIVELFSEGWEIAYDAKFSVWHGQNATLRVIARRPTLSELFTAIATTQR